MIAITLGFRGDKNSGQVVNLYTGRDADKARAALENPPKGVLLTQLFLNPQYTKRRDHVCCAPAEVHVFPEVEADGSDAAEGADVDVLELPEVKEKLAEFEGLAADLDKLTIEHEARGVDLTKAHAELLGKDSRIAALEEELEELRKKVPSDQSAVISGEPETTGATADVVGKPAAEDLKLEGGAKEPGRPSGPEAPRSQGKK